MLNKITLSCVALLALTACSTGYNKKKLVVTPEVLPSTNQFTNDVVYFDYNRSDLNATARATLEQQACALRNGRGAQVAGHCDERGTREYNIALGHRRANAVAEFLRANGANGNITTTSYGKDRPAVEGHNEAAWQQNRRAVTIPQ